MERHIFIPYFGSCNTIFNQIRKVANFRKSWIPNILLSSQKLITYLTLPLYLKNFPPFLIQANFIRTILEASHLNKESKIHTLFYCSAFDPSPLISLSPSRRTSKNVWAVFYANNSGGMRGPCAIFHLPEPPHSHLHYYTYCWFFFSFFIINKWP